MSRESKLLVAGCLLLTVVCAVLLFLPIFRGLPLISLPRIEGNTDPSEAPNQGVASPAPAVVTPTPSVVIATPLPPTPIPTETVDVASTGPILLQATLADFIPRAEPAKAFVSTTDECICAGNDPLWSTVDDLKHMEQEAMSGTWPEAECGWIEVQPQRGQQGLWKIGPVEVPRAERYRLFVWQDGGTYYDACAKFPAERPADGVLDLGMVHPGQATGLRLHFLNNEQAEKFMLVDIKLNVLGPEDARARYGNSLFEASPAPHWRAIYPLIAPDLYEHLQTKLPLIADTSVPFDIVPLTNALHAVVIVQTVTGARSRPIIAQLNHGEITRVDVDIAKLFQPEDFKTYDLRGQLLARDTREPVAGMWVYAENNPLSQAQQTDEEGRFLFTDLPRGQVLQFLASVEEPRFDLPQPASESSTTVVEHLAPDQLVEGLLRFPSPQALFHEAPALEAEDDQVTAIFELACYRFLVTDLTPLHENLMKRPAPTFPVYTLEKFIPGEKSWRQMAIDMQFRSTTAIATSVIADGFYRLRAEVTPLEVYHSEQTEFTAGDAVRNVTMENPDEVERRD